MFLQFIIWIKIRINYLYLILNHLLKFRLDCVKNSLKIKVFFFRSGKVGVDAKSLVKLLVATAGNLCHVFLAVIYFTSLYWLIFFKQQSNVHTLLPAPDQVIYNYTGCLRKIVLWVRYLRADLRSFLCNNWRKKVKGV